MIKERSCLSQVVDDLNAEKHCPNLQRRTLLGLIFSPYKDRVRFRCKLHPSATSEIPYTAEMWKVCPLNTNAVSRRPWRW